MKTFLTHSLGCRVNQAEIEEISQRLFDLDLVPWTESPKAPDLILINTCVVTQKAARETRQIIRKFKRAHPKAFIAVLGCGVDAHQKLKIDLPEVDLLISNEEKSNTAHLISRSLGHKFVPFVPLIHSNKYLSSGRKLLKIQDGCDQYCTFCIVPSLRGKPKSKKPEEVIKSCQAASLSSCQEVILTGINLSLYGKNLKPQTTLTQLLKRILKETNIPRISLSSLTPEVITDEFVNLYLQNWKSGQGRLSPYWHLAIQSGSPKVLQKMGRKTDLKSLKKSLYLIKQRIPEFVFRADFLVGFPGETEKDFKQTLLAIGRSASGGQLTNEPKISFTHVFPFSKRAGTTACKMIEKGGWQDLPPQVKKDRVKQAIAKTRKVRKAEAQKLIGKILPCLFLDKKEGYWQALADNSWPVRIKTLGSNPKGSVGNIKITGAKTDYLLGNILSFPT